MPDDITGVTDSSPESIGILPEQAAPESAPQEGQPQVDDSASNQTEAIRVLREEMTKYRNEADFYRQQATFFQQQQVQPPQPQKPEYEPDDIITYRDIDKIVGSRLEKQRQEMARATMLRQEQEAILKYPDFPEVVEKLKARLSPAQIDALLKADNPAEEIYHFGKAYLPEYARKTATQGITQQIQKNLGQPKTLTNVNGQQNDTSYNSLQDAPVNEFKARIEEYLRS